MPAYGARKCLSCGSFFHPHPRSKGRQRYCSQTSCQKASKAASQKKWRSKPQNQNYFKGPENIERVRQWRAKNPGYWKNSPVAPHSDNTLQEVIMTQDVDSKEENTSLNEDALQEVLSAQPFVLIGLIAHLTGSALQDDLVKTGRRRQQ